MRSITFLDCAASPAGRRPLPRRGLAAALLLALAPFAADAATVVVTSPDDSDSSQIGTCTLRQAIMTMDVGGLVAGCHNSGGAFGADDTITFAESAITGAATPGTVTLADSADAGGGIGGTLLVTAAHLTIDGSAWRGSGAGQYTDGVTIARPDGASNKFGIFKDTAPAGSSLALNGLALRNGDAFVGSGGGIAMDAADLAMSDSRVSGNSANNGGGIWSPSGALTLTRCTIDHNVAYLGGGVYSHSGAVTVTASTIDGNGSWNISGGGGIHADGILAVVDSTISGNLGKRGAGIQTSGTLTLSRSVVIGNDAYYDGSGIHIVAGTATVTGTTVANNTARYVGGGIASYSGATLDVTNSTISGNHTGRGGAGIHADGNLTLRHATVSGNVAGSTGGGIGGAGHGTIEHSIAAGNMQASGSDVALTGTWTGSHNLTSTTNLELGPLQDNGGTTPTMMPGAGSAAIDAIALGDCVENVDQRGISRPQGAGCDIGAVEVAPDEIFADGFE